MAVPRRQHPSGKLCLRPSDMLDGMKLLFWLALAWFVFWWLRRLREPKERASAAKAPPVAEKMIACDFCGVNHPVGESLKTGEGHYCCEVHLNAARAAGQPPGES